MTVVHPALRRFLSKASPFLVKSSLIWRYSFSIPQLLKLSLPTECGRTKAASRQNDGGIWQSNQWGQAWRRSRIKDGAEWPQARVGLTARALAGTGRS